MSTRRDKKLLWYFLSRVNYGIAKEYLSVKICVQDELISVEFYTTPQGGTYYRALNVSVIDNDPDYQEEWAQEQNFNENISYNVALFGRQRLLSTIYEDWGIYISYDDYKNLFNESHEKYLEEVLPTVIEVYNNIPDNPISSSILRLKPNQLLSLIEMIIENNITDDDSHLLFNIRSKIDNINLGYLADQKIAEYRFNNTSIARNIRYSEYIVHHIRKDSMDLSDIMIIINRYLNKEIVVDYDNFVDSLIEQLTKDNIPVEDTSYEYKLVKIKSLLLNLG